MAYKAFKMKGSPMKRNFGIGEKEEVSPTKKGVLGKVLSTVGDIATAAADAGAGTSHQADKEAKRKAAADEEKQKEKDELAHKRALEISGIGSKIKKAGSLTEHTGTDNPELNKDGLPQSDAPDWLNAQNNGK
jgi:hypothetical protein